MKRALLLQRIKHDKWYFMCAWNTFNAHTATEATSPGPILIEYPDVEIEWLRFIFDFQFGIKNNSKVAYETKSKTTTITTTSAELTEMINSLMHEQNYSHRKLIYNGKYDAQTMSAHCFQINVEWINCAQI